MAETDNEIAHEFVFFRVYKDGRIVLFYPTAKKIPPSDDPITGVQSKDVVVSTEPPVSVRIFLPKIIDRTRKLPVLLYMHGGGFCMQSAFSRRYHNYVSSLIAEANIIAVSVEYGLFPDRPIPACYDDSWAALQWVASHVYGNGSDPWLNEFSDFRRVFIGGDSAGGNITHTLLVRVAKLGLPGVNIVGAILVHPYFAGTQDDKMWMYMCPENGGLSDPRMKPAAEDLAKLACERMVLFAAEKDYLFNAGKSYAEELKKSGWCGKVEFVENLEEDHCFHLSNTKSGKALELLQQIVSFIKQN
ncbi:2-hydroxyisoflavanone dehydratase-like [Quillaja saponaria]|uniref:2-hydroxyisoflavanone dehydratase-like n=1 Tax=Quillaja saponaria TaxID=32244 RepID=A0AAD7PU91_QUISA|nr:2-hydroxyisoflavanone dehydratase-like [Quillaja saponaria]